MEYLSWWLSTQSKERNWSNWCKQLANRCIYCLSPLSPKVSIQESRSKLRLIGMMPPSLWWRLVCNHWRRILRWIQARNRQWFDFVLTWLQGIAQWEWYPHKYQPWQGSQCFSHAVSSHKPARLSCSATRVVSSWKRMILFLLPSLSDLDHRRGSLALVWGWDRGR